MLVFKHKENGAVIEFADGNENVISQLEKEGFELVKEEKKPTKSKSE